MSAPALDCQLWLRHRFLYLLSLCLRPDERKKYGDLLPLIDAHAVETDREPVMTSGVDAAAWYVLQFVQQLMFELWNNPLPRPQTPDELADIVSIRSADRARLERFAAAIESTNWKQAAAAAPQSGEPGSLFARLLVNAALNRHLLETTAFAKRVFALYPMQAQLLEELRATAPQGLAEVIREEEPYAPEDYAAIAQAMLAHSFAEKPRTLSANVIARIDAQAHAVLDSAKSDVFAGESDLNSRMYYKRDEAKLWLWLILTWCYIHAYRIPNENPGVHNKEVAVVTTRSNLIEVGQDMSSLRRMLRTILFSHQSVASSPERLDLYARRNSDMRTLMKRALIDMFKGASLAQWSRVARAILPEPMLLKAVQKYEVHPG